MPRAKSTRSRTAKRTNGKRHHTSTGPRPSWSGTLRFGLVTFSVRAFNALAREGERPDLHLLHAICHRKIQYEKYCPLHVKVENDEIVSAYEYSKGKYIEFDSDELEALRSPPDQTLRVDTFVSPEEVDSIYFDGRMYFLRPGDDPATEPFRLFQKALGATNRCGIGQAVFFGKEQLLLLRPYEDEILMQILNYAQEIRDEAELPKISSHSKLPTRKLQLAEKLIAASTKDDFDITTYHNDYREKFQKLINRKMHGKKIVEPEEEETEEPDVINLADALERSLKKVRTPTRRAPARTAPTHRAPAVAHRTRPKKKTTPTPRKKRRA